MIHPVFTRLVDQPGLFAEHAAAYFELATAEVRQFGAVWQKRVVLSALAAIAVVLAIGATSTAAMLAGAVVWERMPAPWALWVVPGAIWLFAMGCGVAAWLTRPQPMFSLLRQQFVADVHMLDEAGRS